MPSFTSLITVLSLSAAVLARTDLTGCTSSDTVAYGGASVIWYVPGSGEICAFLDCGGGMAPPKTNVPGCAAYSGTASYSPSYLTGWGSATATDSSAWGSTWTTAASTPTPSSTWSRHTSTSAVTSSAPVTTPATSTTLTTPTTPAAPIITSYGTAYTSPSAGINGTATYKTLAPSASPSALQSNDGVVSRSSQMVVLAIVVAAGIVLA